LIPLIVNPAERTGANNELATTACPATQRHIQRIQRRDGTPPTSSGASREGDEVAMSPDGGDTSPPPELSAGDGLVVLQCTDCCTPQTQPRPTSGRGSEATSQRSLHHRCQTIAPLRRLPRRAVSFTHEVPRPPLTRATPPACNQ
jgi:hypothetical protein